MSEHESDGGIGIAGITPEEARLRAEGPDSHSRRVPLVDRLAPADLPRLEADVAGLEAVRDELAAALHRLWVAVHYQSAVPEAMAEAGRLLARPSITIAQCLAGEEP